MANIFVKIGKDIELGAEDLLKWITKGAAVTARAGPNVLAAFGVLAGAVEKSLTDIVGAAASGGVNIVLDMQTVTDLKAVWPDVKAFLATLGVKV